MNTVKKKIILNKHLQNHCVSNVPKAKKLKINRNQSKPRDPFRENNLEIYMNSQTYSSKIYLLEFYKKKITAKEICMKRG